MLNPARYRPLRVLIGEPYHHQNPLPLLQQSKAMPITKDNIGGVILAGGKSSRMDFENKALLPLGGKPLIAHVIDGAQAQVERLVINANRDLEHFDKFALPVMADTYGPDAGPLAGIITGMQFSRKYIPDAQALACFPADVPWFPKDIVAQLAHALNFESTLVACLCTNGQWQPLFSLWSLALEDVVAAALRDNMYSPMALIRSLPNSVININASAPGDFANLNTPRDLAEAQEQLQASNYRR